MFSKIKKIFHFVKLWYRVITVAPIHYCSCVCHYKAFILPQPGTICKCEHCEKDEHTVTMDTDGNIHRPDGTIEIIDRVRVDGLDPKKGYVFDIPEPEYALYKTVKDRPRKPSESLTFRRHKLDREEQIEKDILKAYHNKMDGFISSRKKKVSL